MENSAYIDEFTLITVPYFKIEQKLLAFSVVKKTTHEPLKIKYWIKNDHRGCYEIYLDQPIELNLEYEVFVNNEISISVKVGQVVRTKEFDERYYDEHVTLGANYSKDKTIFKVWAPTANQVFLLLNNSGEYECTRTKKGVWEREVEGDLDGCPYMFRVLVNGKWRDVVDPYAKAVTVNGEQGVVVNLETTNPKNWGSLNRPVMEQRPDAIVYEIHIRDFSISDKSGMKARGKFQALIEEGTRGPRNTVTGLDYLCELGITHVQLMPVQDFGSVDETNPFETYNWGYDTVHFQAIEGSYSLNPHDPKLRIMELKEVVQCFHKKGLRVIFDVVFNHMYIHKLSNLENLVPGYYFRYYHDGTLADGTGVGNDIASERKMSRKLIVDSVLYFANEFAVDGFRFDLMGNLDIETMQEIRHKLNEICPTIMMIGEGWDLSTPLVMRQKAIIENNEQLQGISFFNDRFRDMLKGNIFIDQSKGFCNGNTILKDECKPLLSGSIKNFYKNKGIFCEPYQSVNYVECHDNHTLWDKLALANGEENEDVRKRMHRLATAMTILSQGIPFIHGGQEFLRTKGCMDNSYQASDEINQFDWELKSEQGDLIEYVKGLITIKKTFPLLRLPSSDRLKKAMYFLESPPTVIAYLLKEKDDFMIVAHNGGSRPTTFPLPLKVGWEVLVEGDLAKESPIRELCSSTMMIQEWGTIVLRKKK